MSLTPDDLQKIQELIAASDARNAERFEKLDQQMAAHTERFEKLDQQMVASDARNAERFEKVEMQLDMAATKLTEEIRSVGVEVVKNRSVFLTHISNTAPWAHDA